MTAPPNANVHHEVYQRFDIEICPFVTPETFGRKSIRLIKASREGVDAFTAQVEVAVQSTADAERRENSALDHAIRFVHGLIDLGRQADASDMVLIIGSGFDPFDGDARTSDESLRMELLRALHRMYRAQTLTSRVLELDVGGIALVLRVIPARVRQVLGELVSEGLAEGFAESFGATAADGRCRITGLGLQMLRSLEQDPEEVHRLDGVDDWAERHGHQWAELEVRLRGLKAEFDAATDLDGFQDVGRRCREILKDAANVVFEESMVDDEGSMPGRDDAKARIGYYLKNRMSGSSHRDLRVFVKKAHTLSQTVTHSSHTDRIAAFVAAQATLLIVRTLQQMDAAE